MSMRIVLSALGSLALIATASHVIAREPMPQTKVSMEECLAVALESYPGKVKEVEFGLEDGVPHYEFEILTADKRGRYPLMRRYQGRHPEWHLIGDPRRLG